MKTELSSVLVLGKFAKILDYLTGNNVAMSVSAMSRTLGIPRATLYRLLESLQAQDIIVQRDGRYEIGLRMLTWGARALDASSVRQVVYPYMKTLQQETGLTVSLFIRNGDSRICLESMSAEGSAFAPWRVGEQLALHACASGTALLAWLPEDLRDQLLEASHRRFGTVPFMERTEDWWSEIRKQGWVMLGNQATSELAGLAAPIFDRSGAPVAAIAMCGSAQGFANGDLDAPKIGQRLLEITAQINDTTDCRQVA
jgi:IclR family acetate operon transcriptional repressor